MKITITFLLLILGLISGFSLASEGPSAGSGSGSVRKADVTTITTGTTTSVVITLK